MLEPLVVVARREIGAELGAPGLGALERGEHDRLGAVDHVAELDRAQHVLVEDGAAIVDPGLRRLLFEACNRLARSLQPLPAAEHRRLAVHQLAELVLDLRDAPALPRARDDRLDQLAVPPQGGDGVGLGHAHAGGARRRVLARAPPEDERVEQRVGAQAVAAVHRHARHLAGGVEPLDRRTPVYVGLDPTHYVVLAGTDRDRFARDVHAGEVLAEADDLAQRLQRALAGHDRDVEIEAVSVWPHAAALVDLDLLRTRDHVA